MTWPQGEPKATWLSDNSEKRGPRITAPVEVPAASIVTLRAEF